MSTFTRSSISDFSFKSCIFQSNYECIFLKLHFKDNLLVDDFFDFWLSSQLFSNPFAAIFNKKQTSKQPFINSYLSIRSSFRHLSFLLPQMFFFLALLALTCAASLAAAEVVVYEYPQTIYNRYPTIRVRGFGFPSNASDIVLELSAPNQPPLTVGAQYVVIVDHEGDGLVLVLRNGQRWVNFNGRVGSLPLVLTSVKFTAFPEANQLRTPVVLANILPLPFIRESNVVMYTTASKELRIFGLSFVGAKMIEFYFDPPLIRGVDYNVTSQFPLTENYVSVRLLPGRKWRLSPGPIIVSHVDTGGSALPVGVVVAYIQADREFYGSLFVDSVAIDQVVYHDQATLTITGWGFNTSRNKLYFAHKFDGDGINYTMTAASNKTLTLRLAPQSSWLPLSDLPGYITVLAMDAGPGIVPVGPGPSAEGAKVATVFARPTIHPFNKKLFRTQSRELYIKGTGFVHGLPLAQFKFYPPLVEGEDYTVTAVDHTEVKITLAVGSAWRADKGPLHVMAINTRGDEAGWINYGMNAIQVAAVVDDLVHAVIDTGLVVTARSVKPSDRTAVGDQMTSSLHDLPASATAETHEIHSEGLNIEEKQRNSGPTIVGAEAASMDIHVNRTIGLESIALSSKDLKSSGVVVSFEADGVEDSVDFGLDMGAIPNKVTIRARPGARHRSDTGFKVTIDRQVARQQQNRTTSSILPSGRKLSTMAGERDSRGHHRVHRTRSEDSHRRHGLRGTRNGP